MKLSLLEDQLTKDNFDEMYAKVTSEAWVVLHSSHEYRRIADEIRHKNLKYKELKFVRYDVIGFPISIKGIINAIAQDVPTNSVKIAQKTLDLISNQQFALSVVPCGYLEVSIVDIDKSLKSDECAPATKQFIEDIISTNTLSKNPEDLHEYYVKMKEKYNYDFTTYGFNSQLFELYMKELHR